MPEAEKPEALDEWDVVQEELEARVEARADQLLASESEAAPGACNLAVDVSSVLLSAFEPPFDE